MIGQPPTPAPVQPSGHQVQKHVHTVALSTPMIASHLPEPYARDNIIHIAVDACAWTCRCMKGRVHAKEGRQEDIHHVRVGPQPSPLLSLSLPKGKGWLLAIGVKRCPVVLLAPQNGCRRQAYDAQQAQRHQGREDLHMAGGQESLRPPWEIHLNVAPGGCMGHGLVTGSAHPSCKAAAASWLFI